MSRVWRNSKIACSKMERDFSAFKMNANLAAILINNRQRLLYLNFLYIWTFLQIKVSSLPSKSSPSTPPSKLKSPKWRPPVWRTTLLWQICTLLTDEILYVKIVANFFPFGACQTFPNSISKFTTQTNST